jgi:cytoskeletal protein CcmA (bactofilin family)
MFNKRTNYDRVESGDALSALDRELGSETTPAAPTTPPATQQTAAEPEIHHHRGTSSETVLSEGCNFNGKATVAGTLRVEGRVQGEVRATDTVVIGRSGKVEANIATNRAIFNGAYSGKVEAKDRVELQNGSRVEGDIIAKNMVMEDGVYFRGNCQIGTK